MGHAKKAIPLALAALALTVDAAGTGCSPSQKARPGTQSRWEARLRARNPLQKPEPKPARKIAQAQDAPAGPKELRQELERLESARGGIHGLSYLVLPHELTYAWDRSRSISLSESPQWRELSGWREETVVLPSQGTTASRTIRSKQRPTEGKDGFVHEAAARGPAEDLTETAAWVRFRPELAAQRSPLKARYLSLKLFGGRTYDADGLERFYVDDAVEAVAPQILDGLNGCALQKPASLAADLADFANRGAAVAGSAHLKLDVPLPEPLVACIEADLRNRVSEAFERLKARERGASEVLARKETELRARVFDRLSPEVSRLARESSSPLIQSIQDLRASVESQVDPREAYVHCFRQAQPESCYQQAIHDAFDRAAQPFAQKLGEMLPSEKTAYLSRHPYGRSQADSTRFYGEVFAEVEPQLAAAAETRWQKCMAASPASPSPDPASGGPRAEPLVEPFSGGSRFVSASMLACINSSHEEDVRQVRDSHLRALGLDVSDSDVETLIQGMLLPTYLAAFDAKLDSSASKEDSERAQRKPGVIDVLASELTRETTWLGSVAGAEPAAESCAAAAGAAFDAYFRRVAPEERLPARFAAMEDIRNAWGREACARVLATPHVARELEQRDQKAWIAALAALEKAVAERARDKAVDCSARHSALAAQAERRRCLIADKAWSTIESQALVDWAQTPEGRSFASTRKKDALAYLGDRPKRGALQAAAVRAMQAR
jgi:hypothetical protein